MSYLVRRKDTEPFNSVRKDINLSEGCKTGRVKVTTLYRGSQRNYTSKTVVEIGLREFSV